MIPDSQMRGFVFNILNMDKEVVNAEAAHTAEK
jgi:hypothetical protein